MLYMYKILTTHQNSEESCVITHKIIYEAFDLFII